MLNLRYGRSEHCQTAQHQSSKSSCCQMDVSICENSSTTFVATSQAHTCASIGNVAVSATFSASSMWIGKDTTTPLMRGVYLSLRDVWLPLRPIDHPLSWNIARGFVWTAMNCCGQYFDRELQGDHSTSFWRQWRFVNTPTINFTSLILLIDDDARVYGAEIPEFIESPSEASKESTIAYSKVYRLWKTTTRSARVDLLDSPGDNSVSIADEKR